MKKKKETFPDGTPIDNWFYDIDIPKLNTLGKQYVLTQYNIFDDGKVHTTQIQKLIDTAAQNGGGVIVVPAGTYLTGSLFFKPGVNLYISKGGTLKGSDDISDYPVCETRIEGENCKYFAALINAEGIDGFKILGEGTIDGNGLKAWRSFWLRRKWNPNCTNKDEQRARLIYLANCKNAMIAGLNLQNSQFWTNHIYKCQYVKFIDCRIYSPATPVKAPSTDAIDIDVCRDVLIHACYMEVNDDSVVLKGGKGPWADRLPENGTNERIIIEDCTYGFCHGCLTCGSESIHNKNIILRRGKILTGKNLLWLKMRPDTPQLYEYITVEDMVGKINSFINIHPWTQFYDLKDRSDIPLSTAQHIVMQNCDCRCNTYFDIVEKSDQYKLSNFTFKDLNIHTVKNGFTKDIIQNVTVENVTIQDKK